MAWVTEEVLPTIRKTGSYSVAPALTREEQLAQACLLANQVIAEKDEKIGLLTEYNHRLSLENNEVKEERDTYKEELGFHGTYRSLKAITDRLKKYFNMNNNEVRKALGKELSRLSRYSGAPLERVPDGTYGSVNVYHVDIIEEFFDDLKNDRFYMEALRKKPRQTRVIHR